ncbi:MAG TPA: DUF1615 domain-containing protein [Steroidobacteraceae bacterium]
MQRPKAHRPEPHRLALLALATLLGSCASERANGPRISEADAHTVIEQALPATVSDKTGWADDIYAAFSTQQIEPTKENVCAVVAVIAQESNFQVNPVVPGMSQIAWKEIHNRADHTLVPWLVVKAALDLKSPTGRTYSERIDHARTERDLSDIYEDFIDSVPLGHTLFESHNPIRTRGPMQVNVAFLKQTSATRSYPYTVKGSLQDELFTRRGSVYFGVAHLLGYHPPYPRYLYRFADFNAGQYASRNAAFQNALATASGRSVTPDGTLGEETEAALRGLGDRLNVSNDDIHSALEEAKSADFEHTTVYKRVFALAERAQKRSAPQAAVPKIKLEGPKLSRTLTTDWYAHRVDGRFQQCVKKSP